MPSTLSLVLTLTNTRTRTYVCIIMKTRKEIEEMLSVAQKMSNKAITSLSDKKQRNSLEKIELSNQITASSTVVNVLRMVLSDETFDKEEQDYFLSICG